VRPDSGASSQSDELCFVLQAKENSSSVALKHVLQFVNYQITGNQGQIFSTLSKTITIAEIRQE